MKKLIEEINNVKKSKTNLEIIKRLKEFESFKNKSNDEWFCELCFCILTANSKAQTAINIQNQIGAKGFLNLTQKELSKVIKDNKHRFHNNKSKFIVEARKHKNTKDIIKSITNLEDEKNAREWLVKNVKGISYKESSHFLRNVGYKNVAILDRHIINIMLDNKIIKDKPKSLNKNTYLEIEAKLDKFASKLNMDHAKLDLYLWYLKTGTVLK